MTEVVLPIIRNGDYNNVQLKPKWNKTKLVFEGGVKPEQTVILTKKFAEGVAVTSNKFTNKDGSPTVSYTCKAVDANGVEVSFWLTESEHKDFVAAGGPESKFSVTSVRENIINRMTGAEIPRYRLVFTALEQ